MINLEVHSTYAVIRSQEPLTVGLRGAKASFAFGEPWEGLVKTAVFRQGQKTVAVTDIGQEVTIPWEVLTLPGVPVMIGVYGVDAAGAIAIPTLWAQTEPVRPGADPEADPSTEPIPGLWEQMQEKMGSLEQLDTEEKSNLVAAINEAKRAIYVVDVTKEADGSYKANKTVQQLMAAHADEKVLVCRALGLWMGLSSVYNHANFEFTAIKDRTKVCIAITEDGKVTCNSMSVVSTDGRLPNPKKLTFIGAAKAEYDGSEEVIVGIPTKVSQLSNDSGFLTEAPVTAVNGQTGEVTVPTPVKVTVTRQSDGSYTADLRTAQILAAYQAGSAVYCCCDQLVLALSYAALARCIFTCIYNDRLHTVVIAPSGTTVTDTALGSGNGDNGITPHIGDNGNWFIGETDTGMPSRGEDAPQEAILYTPQALTTEQQTQARQNIGAIEAPETAEVGQTIVVKEVDENDKPILWEAAGFPVSGAANDNPLELISDITLEEDVDIIIIEQDDNGEPFELENFMLETRARSSVEGTSTGGVTGHVIIGGLRLQNCNHAGQQDAVFNVNTMYRIFNSGLAVFRVFSTGAGSMISPTVCKELLLAPTIKKITLKNATANVRYLAGSSIKLYGRRVKK